VCCRRDLVWLRLLPSEFVKQHRAENKRSTPKPSAAALYAAHIRSQSAKALDRSDASFALTLLDSDGVSVITGMLADKENTIRRLVASSLAVSKRVR
jgi:hypothetical protein